MKFLRLTNNYMAMKNSDAFNIFQAQFEFGDDYHSMPRKGNFLIWLIQFIQIQFVL